MRCRRLNKTGYSQRLSLKSICRFYNESPRKNLRSYICFCYYFKQCIFRLREGYIFDNILQFINTELFPIRRIRWSIVVACGLRQNVRRFSASVSKDCESTVHSIIFAFILSKRKFTEEPTNPIFSGTI